MSTYPDLEIGLNRSAAESYSIELRFSLPGGETETRCGPIPLRQDQVNLDQFDTEALIYDPMAYGKALWAAFFGDDQVQSGIDLALRSAETLNLPLRMRLFIGPSAPELQSLRWETLRDPRTDRSLMTDENLLFSRYLSSLDWRRIDLRPQSDLRALLVVANPKIPEKFGLAPIDAAGEASRASLALSPIAVTQLVEPGAATLNRIAECLREDYDIVYLVCHGAFADGEPWLWLDDEDGQATRVPGARLVERIGDLIKRPRLVVLASCQSAAGRGALSALGPHLAEVGVPAVVAMQADIAQQTVADFIPVFFKALQEDGVIDHAMARARGAVADNLSDWWVPVLFMRLKSGRVWYKPGFQDDFKKWPMLRGHIRSRRCVPIVGPAVIEPLIGSSHTIARKWAEKFHYPLAPDEFEDLPQVAQYLAVDQDKFTMKSELAETIWQSLRRYDSAVGNEVPPLEAINGLIGQVWQRRWGAMPTELHNVLAGLPFEIYITTNQDDLLTRALTAKGKSPEVELCCWYRDWDYRKSVLHRRPDYMPSVEQPLVYHLFGSYDDPHSLVLTEDDYFDFLIGFANGHEQIPPSVPSALTRQSLLFLGFQTQDWPFRAVFRSIMALEGAAMSQSGDVQHVAVQIDPEEGYLVEPEGAREYLQTYVKDAHISIYWDSTEDFARELINQMNVKPN